MGRWARKPEARFWEKVEKTNGCWNWVAGLDRGGYGMFSLNGTTVKAHRYVWELTFGVIPNGLFVCHQCDNTRCVNYHHLFLGTNSINQMDSVGKGRRTKTGVQQPGKLRGLSGAIVLMRDDGVMIQEIADLLHVSRQAISYHLKRHR